MDYQHWHLFLKELFSSKSSLVIELLHKALFSSGQKLCSIDTHKFIFYKLLLIIGYTT